MRWSDEQTWAWYRSIPWLCGFNYVPSTAVNSTEMWQQKTFDPKTIDRELEWAKAIGFNTCRVFLQYLVWESDPGGMLQRMEYFLEIAHRHGLSTMLILFDDCAFAGKEPHLGSQDEPVPGLHNSGWTPSPGPGRVLDRDAWRQLEQYVQEIVGRFREDDRILAWDLYNEPGNSGMGDSSLPLLQACFGWARTANPRQPLTTAIWDPHLGSLNQVIAQESDILSFHDYNDLDAVRRQVTALQALGRPLLCTEWMRRNFGSHFETHLPYFKEENIGSFFWGLVNGRTQTHFPWGSPQNAPEPPIWFHDLLDQEGNPHRSEEIALIRQQILCDV